MLSSICALSGLQTLELRDQHNLTCGSNHGTLDVLKHISKLTELRVQPLSVCAVRKEGVSEFFAALAMLTSLLEVKFTVPRVNRSKAIALAAFVSAVLSLHMLEVRALQDVGHRWGSATRVTSSEIS